MARSSMNLKKYSIEQLEKLFAQIEREKTRRSKDVQVAKQKILSMMKEFSLSVADFAETALKKSASATKKTRRKKATRKGAKATPAKAPGAPTAKKSSNKKTRNKVAPKYANPEDQSMKWTGRGRQPLWVVAALKAGKTMEDLKI